MSKRWPWPCAECFKPDHEHIDLNAKPGVLFAMPKLKCAFASTMWRGMTAQEFIHKMWDAAITDRNFYDQYHTRLQSALDELSMDLADRRFSGREVTRNRLRDRIG